MQGLIHRLDPTRQVTMAANVGNAYFGINRIIDVRGWNYHIGRDMDDYHAAHPDQPNVGTEQASTVCTRGIYANDRSSGYVSAYDDNAPPWAHTARHGGRSSLPARGFPAGSPGPASITVANLLLTVGPALIPISAF